MAKIMFHDPKQPDQKKLYISQTAKRVKKFKWLFFGHLILDALSLAAFLIHRF